MSYPEYYNILGVKTDASPDEIKQAYIRLVKQYHPDTHQGDKKSEEKLKRINEAYDVLKDLAKRAEYDYCGNISNQEEQTEIVEAYNYPQPFEAPHPTPHQKNSALNLKSALRWMLWKLFLIVFLVLYAIFLYAHRDPKEPDNWFKMLSNSSQAILDGGKKGLQIGFGSLFNSTARRQKLIDGMFYIVRHDQVTLLDKMLQILPADSIHFYINATDKQNYNRTLLMEAQNAKIIQILLEAGAIVNQADDLGETALTLAVRRGDAVAAELLLQAGADAAYVLPDGTTPLKLAIRNNDIVIMTLLQARIKKR